MGRRQRGQTQRITSLRYLMPDRRQVWRRTESAPPDCTRRVGEVPVGTFAFRRRFSQGWNPNPPCALRRGAHQRKKWCGRWDSNPQAFRHRPLKTACLPVPPLPHKRLLYPRPDPAGKPALLLVVGQFHDVDFAAEPGGQTVRPPRGRCHGARRELPICKMTHHSTPVREPAVPPAELRSVQCLPPPALLPLFPAPRSATQPKSAAARHKRPAPAKRP